MRSPRLRDAAGSHGRADCGIIRAMKPSLLPLLAAALLLPACAPRAAVPVYGYRVVHAYPHDTQAFTEGLFYRDGLLYESTGTVGPPSTYL